MTSKIWSKYEKIKEINTNSNIKTYLANFQPIIKEIDIFDKNKYDIISQKLEELKDEIYEIIEEENNKIYIVLENNEELLLKIDNLILTEDINIITEGIIEGQGNPVKKKEINELLKKEKSLCKINFKRIEKGQLKSGHGTGFFCKFDNSIIKYGLITNNHILNEDNLQIGKKIEIELYNLNRKEIILTGNRYLFTNQKLDYTCIELFESDGIINYFEIDPYINEFQNIKDQDIFILQFPDEISFSYGKITLMKNNRFRHTASTEKGSSGSPIIIRNNNNYVFGLHSGGKTIDKEKKKFIYNVGTPFNLILNDIQNHFTFNCIYDTYNHAKIKLLNDYFFEILTHGTSYYKELQKWHKLMNDHIDIYINNKKINFDYYYITNNNEREIKVKFIFKKKISEFSLSKMFSECYSLKSIDFSSFDAINITDMSSMFMGCGNLESINFSSFFKTINVKNMNSLFAGCKSLRSLDLTSFNTTNVIDMSYMFSFCSSLGSIDLTSFNTSNVIDMGYMFDHCESLISLDLSSFNTINVINMDYMFYYCSRLRSLDLSHWNSINVKNMSFMFYQCTILHILKNRKLKVLKTNDDKILEKFFK